jgi:hypothetical protein
VHRNSEVSPWFPLLLLAYPIWETLFSMYRRRMRGCSAGEADALHLHSLVYRRLVRWKGYEALPADYVARNSIASACLWVLPACCLAIALSFWGNSVVLQSAAVIFAMLYTWLYLRIVRFGMPGWMTISSGSAMQPQTDGEQQNIA